MGFRRRSVLLCLAVGCFSLALPCMANAMQAAVSMEEAIKKSLSWHPSIATAKARLEEQQYRHRVVKSGYYPQVSGGAKGGFEGRRSEQKYSQSLTLTLSQLIYDFGQTGSEVSAEQAEYARRQAELFKTIEDNINHTSTAVHEVWRNQLLEQAALDQHQALSELTELVNERFEKGAATRSDWVQSKTRVESAFTQILKFQNQKLLWQNRLASLLGYSRAIGVRQVPPSFAHQLCYYQEENLSSAPSMLMAYAARDTAQANSKKAFTRSYPRISLDPSVTHYTKRAHWSNGDSPERTEYGVFINVNMPLYQGGALSAERKMASAGQMAAEADILSEKQRILEVLFTSYAQQQVLAQEAETLKQREALSVETRQLYQQQYLEMGVRPLIDLLNAEQEIYQTRFEQINNTSDSQLLELSCAHELGRLYQLFDLAGTQVQGVELE